MRRQGGIMKKTLDWKSLGQFLEVVVLMFSAIRNKFKKMGIGPEIVSWLVGDGRKSLEKALDSLGKEFLATLKTVEAPVDDSIVRVASVKPVYPDWVQKVMHPELEGMGPAESDVGKLLQYLIPGQERGIVTGHAIYKHLKDGDLLESCLGLADLLAIQSKGIVFFRKYFAGKAVFGWRSVVRDRGGDLCVPSLIEYGGGVVLRWRWLGYYFDSTHPALRHAS
jgi:hypothetical protein